MKTQALSDLHIAAIGWVLKYVKTRSVIYILGNHEYWYKFYFTKYYIQEWCFIKWIMMNCTRLVLRHLIQ